MFIEINSTPGTKGYRKATGENLAKNILVKFKNRDYWLKPNTYKSMFEDKIQTDSIEFDGDVVKWSKDGIQYEHDIIGISDKNPIIEHNSIEVELLR